MRKVFFFIESQSLLENYKNRIFSAVRANKNGEGYYLNT